MQRFSLHDGPGARTTVFLQGCNLRCAWCHNPESQPMRGALLLRAQRCIGCGACVEICPQTQSGQSARHTRACTLCGACAQECYAGAIELAGREIDADALLHDLLADRDIYQTSDGGVTFSGGEPLLQPAFLREMLARLKSAGVHTAVESALDVPWADVAGILAHTDLFLADVKAVSDDVHRAGTGAGNARIIDNIRRISESGAQMILRVPVVPGFNAGGAEMARIAAFIASLPQRHRVELLAYHAMCEPKYAALGKAFPMAGVKEPAEAEMRGYAQLLCARGIDTEYRM
ncbi:MAG: glycyl-radical enzyme activating protein [Christensenellales bacterium]